MKNKIIKQLFLKKKKNFQIQSISNLIIKKKIKKIMKKKI